MAYWLGHVFGVGDVRRTKRNKWRGVLSLNMGRCLAPFYVFWDIFAMSLPNYSVCIGLRRLEFR